MNASLCKGDRVRLILNGAEKKHARVKEWLDYDCVNVSYVDAGKLVPGDCIELERLTGEPRSVYYMQVFNPGHEKDGSPGLVLRRNPAASFNMQRRGLRVRYTATTAIRAQGACHFLSAQFINMSLTASGVLSETSFPVDSVVELRLTLPENPEHIVTGLVKRVSPGPLLQDVFGRDLYGLVIQFQSLSHEALRDLTFFMWQRVRKAYSEQLRETFDTTRRRHEHTPSSEKKSGAA